MKLRTVLAAAGLAAFAAQAQAQSLIVPENDKFKISFIGRTNIDAGSYLEEHSTKTGTDADGNAIYEDHNDNGVIVYDTRLGVKGSFNEKWDFKIEINFDKKAISFRDVFVKYNFNKQNHVQVGNFFMPFGMKPLGLAYKFDEDATVDYAFCPSRRIGAAYQLTTDKFNFTGGIFSDGNIDNGNSKVNQGLNLAAKGIYRPVINETTVLHFGLASLYTNSPNAGSFKAVTPNTFAPKTLMTAGFDAPAYSRFEGELIFIKQKFMLEAHWQQAGADERTKDDRTIYKGLLAQASYLLIGEQQNYNKSTGLCANASPRNLEILARYDKIDFDQAGEQIDLTLGLNYFVSKHFNVKLNYVNVSSSVAGKDKESYNMIQTRLQFSF